MCYPSRASDGLRIAPYLDRKPCPTNSSRTLLDDDVTPMSKTATVIALALLLAIGAAQADVRYLGRL